MAGDWMQVDLDLPEKVQVHAILDETELPIDVVCGRIVLFWRWVERHVTDGFKPGATVRSLIRAAGGDESFWLAVSKSGWLCIEPDGLRIPDWEKRFSKASKQRIVNARRQAVYRNSNADSNAARNGRVTLDVTQETLAGNAPPLPKEELSIEELSKAKSPSDSLKSDPVIERRTLEFIYDAIDMDLATEFFQSVQSMLPNSKFPVMVQWAAEFKAMRTKDPPDRNPENIREMFAWAHCDDFWRQAVLTPMSLRKNWDAITMRRDQAANASSKELNALIDDF